MWLNVKNSIQGGMIKRRVGEAFIQWVIEDDFINGRPALENVGVEMVESVLPWEELKSVF
ncbi:hypothetical protein MASR2M36_36750 [Providencia sp.]